MPLVDYERVVLEVKRHVCAKNSHGQRDLLGLIARLEVEHQVEEGLPERALRLYGEELYDLARSDHEPATGGPDGAAGDGHRAHPSSGGQTAPEEPHDRADADPIPA